MSWLNFNDSLNSLKGQITNFASNVLAEDEGQDLSNTEYKDLKELCQQQEHEIKKLRELTEEYERRQKNPEDGSNGSWNWDDNEKSDSKASTESTSSLRKIIALLETEKTELLVQLEQLDADNQENLVNVMRMKEKLQFELNDLNENYLSVKEENAVLIAKEKKLINELKQLNEKDGNADKEKDPGNNKNLIKNNKKLNHEIEELKKELFVIKSSNENFQKIIEDTQKGGEDGINEKIQKIESENKLLYLELKKANEQIHFFEKKSLEDEDNCQKLAFILETYETQVSSLKRELEEFTNKYKEAEKQRKETEMLHNNMKVENENLLSALQEEINNSKEKTKSLEEINDQSDEIERWKKEIKDLRKLNEELQVASNGRMDIALEDELENIRQEHEAQLNILKEELEQLKKREDKNTDDSKKYEEIQKQQKEIVKLYSDLKVEHENIQKKYLIDINALQEEINNFKSNSNQNTEPLEETERWKKEIEDLKKLNEELLVRASGRMDMDLEDELENIQQEHQAQLNVLREELDLLKSEENKNVTDNKRFDELEEEKLEISRELIDLQQQCEYLQDNHKVSLHELHNKYINIITDNIKKFQECEKPSDFEHCVHDDDPQVAELSKHIENIIKILLDLKCKCADLEKRVLEITEEKNNILVEKNHEIEKLIQNSDMLSQEIVTKNQTIKDYENECNDIAKNNELLINELETYKNNPVLQTISESNEDNMILLESQLENANKRIEDLEKIIDDLEQQQSNPDSLEGVHLVEEKINKSEPEINNKKDYNELLNSFDQLQIHYESIKKELDETKEDLSYSNERNLNLQANLEKLKGEYEMFEYQVSELNVNSESLKEEVDEFKQKFNELLTENSKLKLQNEETLEKSKDYLSLIDNLKEKLGVEEENKKSFELQIETVTEKLKNCKMAETSLKLQYEQKSKELAAQSEARYNLEVSLNKINADLAQFQNNFTELQTENDKLLENFQETSFKNDEKVKELENVIKELQEKLDNSSQEAFDKEDEKVKELENVIKELQGKLDNISKPLEPEEDTNAPTITELEIVKKEVNSSEKVGENEDFNNLKQMLDETVLEKANLHAQLSKLAEIQSQLKEATDKGAILHQQLQEVTNSRNELINMVTMKHQENVTYHNEIQRLNQVLTTELEKYMNLEKQFNEVKSKASNEDIQAKHTEIEKLTDQNNFLKEKCEVIAKNLLEEQSKVQQLLAERSVPSEKETTLQKNLDRLQGHLIELEEHYTEELYQAEQKNLELKSRVSEIEEREKSSSTMYTSVSIRANQQVESLQSQLQTVIVERDSLRTQISDAEDQNIKQAAALANLQFVLEQFRKDKEKDVIKETERIRRHIQTEKQVQEELKVEIYNLKSQLEERNQGLLAASRLSDQLESSKKTVSGLKEEVSQLQTKLSKTEEDLTDALSNTDGKVDKLLIKNLILGYVTSNNNMNRDQTQVLKIIATVLDFNQQDHDKVKLNKPQQGWLGSFLAPQPDNQNKISEESLSRAFIKFLENESKPRVVPSLLNNTTTLSESSSTKTTNSRSITPSNTPIVLSEIVLPTFSDFAQNRNSSSILKDVLKDNS